MGHVTCASKAHDKLPKSRKLAFNDIKYLMFLKLNAQISKKKNSILTSLTCAFDAQVNVIKNCVLTLNVIILKQKQKN
jgi:hypothetical protein